MKEKKLLKNYRSGMPIKKIAKKHRISYSMLYYFLGKAGERLRGAPSRYPLPGDASRVQKRFHTYVPRDFRKEFKKPGILIRWKRKGKDLYELKVER